MGHICELQSFNIHLKTHLEKTRKTKRQATDSGTVADNIRSNSSRQHCFKQSQCLLPSSVRFTGTNRCTVALDLDLICLFLFFLQKLPKFWQHLKPFRFKIKTKQLPSAHPKLLKMLGRSILVDIWSSSKQASPRGSMSYFWCHLWITDKWFDLEMAMVPSQKITNTHHK